MLDKGMNSKPLEQNRLDASLEWMKDSIVNEVHDIVEVKTAPYQSALCEMLQEMRNLLRAMDGEQGDQLWAENIRLKAQLKKREYELQELQKLLVVKPGLWKRIRSRFNR